MHRKISRLTLKLPTGQILGLVDHTSRVGRNETGKEAPNETKLNSWQNKAQKEGKRNKGKARNTQRKGRCYDMPT